MVVRQRTEARRVAGLAEPDSGRRRMLRSDPRHQLQAARLTGVAVLVAFPGDHRPVICSHCRLLLAGIGATTGFSRRVCFRTITLASPAVMRSIRARDGGNS